MSLALRQPTVRGWCPGALRPMESGDGLIVRLRPRCGAFATTDLLLIAQLAKRFGNGLIDLTRRANLQLRGLREDDLPALWEALAGAGLLDDSTEAEAVRNVTLNPLAGLDPAEIADLHPIARDLEQRLATQQELWQLPGKFGFALDGGGVLPIAEARADIWLRALQTQDGIKLALGLDRADGIDWLGAADVSHGADLATAAARAFLASCAGSHLRMRHLPQAAYEAMRAGLTGDLTPLDFAQPLKPSKRSLGLLRGDAEAFALGLAAPFGRLEADALERLAQAADRLGIAEIRLSPWRALYAPVEGADQAGALQRIAEDAGFILDETDPLLAIEACPGSSGCASAGLDTRRAACEMAPMLARLGCRSCHISGCAKGCARSAKSDLVLVAGGSGYGVARNATAQDAPDVTVSPGELSRLPSLLGTP